MFEFVILSEAKNLSVPSETLRRFAAQGDKVRNQGGTTEAVFVLVSEDGFLFVMSKLRYAEASLRGAS